MVEYLDEVKSLYNTNKYTVVELTTNKDTYTAKLPYTTKHNEKTDSAYYYSISVRDWCRLRHIIVKDYFRFKHKRLINS